LYGRPVAQPYFDFPNWARYTYCRPAPLAWGYDPIPNYGPCDEGMEFAVPSINCPGDFVAHRPNRWYASADFAPTTFDYQQDVEIARVNGATVLSTSSIDPEFDAGGEFTLGARIFDCYRIEGSYWGSFEWSDSATFQRTGGDIATLLSGGFGNPLTALDDNTLVSISSLTRMNNAEVNLLYWIDMPPGSLDVSLLVGGRFLQIDEQFLLETNAAGDVEVTTDNELWCLQVGLSSDWLLHSRFWVDFDIKGAICNNSVSLVENASGPSFLTAEQDRTSWLGDFSLVGNWQVTPWLVARLGYQALFVNGVALAPHNIETNTVLRTLGPVQIDDSDNIVFHGPVIGIAGVW
jgi:hypothetical protein